MNGARAVRLGDWKLVGPKDQPWELYNVKLDRAETIDLAEQDPERFKTLQEMYRAWSARCNEGR